MEEEITKVVKDTDELQTDADAWENKIKTDLAIEEKLGCPLENIEAKISEISIVSEGVKAVLVAKTALLADLEEQERQMTEEENILSAELSAALNADEQAKVAIEAKLKEVEDLIAKAEQERLLLEGRVFEVTQHGCRTRSV